MMMMEEAERKDWRYSTHPSFASRLRAYEGEIEKRRVAIPKEDEVRIKKLYAFVKYLNN